MTGDAGPSPGPGGRRHEGDLDGDPEALEDPVHRGDATHQHDVHQQHEQDKHQQPGEDAARSTAAQDAASPDDGG